jgi:hypothetical protein
MWHQISFYSKQLKWIPYAYIPPYLLKHPVESKTAQKLIYYDDANAD